MCGGGTSNFALTLERLGLNEIGSNNGTKCSERGDTDSTVDCDGSCWVRTKCQKYSIATNSMSGEYRKREGIKCLFGKVYTRIS